MAVLYVLLRISPHDKQPQHAFW